MRYQGKVTNWRDDKGYGFILPMDGGTQVFVHIKAFTTKARRPVGDENVTYNLETDPEGRIRATRVLFEGERLPRDRPRGKGTFANTVALCFLFALAGVTLAGMLPVVVPGLYLVASVVAFGAYAHDKSAAKNNRWRTPENTLHLLALIGGWPGALVAQGLLRHKSSKQSFQITFWVTVFLNVGALAWLLSSHGSDYLHSQLIDALWLR